MQDSPDRCTRFAYWVEAEGVNHTHGATDEFGFNAVEDRVSVHDLHATILHQLGTDHEHFTYRFQGRRYRLTDVFGAVAPALLA